jgi:hypothetical protein
VSNTDKIDAKTGAGVLGVGAVACAACCAGPILGFLAGLGLTAAVGAVLFGVVGLVVVLVVAGVLWRRRQRRCGPTPSQSESVAVEAPRLRARS